MSFHHLEADEYQGPGVTQLHDTAIEAGLVTAPKRAVPDDVLHYNNQQQRGDDDSSDDSEDDEQLMERLREQMVSQLRQQHDALIAAATTVESSHLRDLTEDEFEQHCLASSHSHLTLLLLHCHTADCLHMSHVLASLARQYPSAVRCVRLLATGDNIARFPLAACPTVLAYSGGRKAGQWGVRDWRRVGGGVGRVEVGDVVRELRRCGLLEASGEDDDEAETDAGTGRMQLSRGSVGAKYRRRGRDDSDHDDDDDG